MSLSGRDAWFILYSLTLLLFMAAPIRAHDGSVVAAISASGPAYRLSEDRIPDASRAVTRAAAEVSRRLGYHPGGREQDD